MKKSANHSHHNLFVNEPGNVTCAFPVELVHYMQKEDIKYTSLALYLYLLVMARASKEPKMKLPTKDILQATGLSRSTLAAARFDLSRLHLVRCVEMSVPKGTWDYEILSVQTRGSLPTRERVEYRDLSDKVVIQFYETYAGGYDQKSGKFKCPFHGFVPNEKKPTLVVTLARGTDHHGRWFCSHCKEHGGFFEFVSRKENIDARKAFLTVQKTLQMMNEIEANPVSKSVVWTADEDDREALI